VTVDDGVESRLEERGKRPSCCSGWRVNRNAYAHGIEVEASYVMH